MAIIVVGGMIGAGKTSVANILGKELESEVFYEDVTDNQILPLFYTADEAEQRAKRYPFLLQLEFLSSRFQSIKQALVNQHNVLDRSIYEDWYFAKINNQMGKISDLEFGIYEKLLDNMLEELEELPKKSPDLMVYLHGSFETILHRIGIRGRDFEQDEGLINYYHMLWSGYDEWVDKHYKASQVLKIDIDQYDFIANPSDVDSLMDLVHKQLRLTEVKELSI